MSDAKKREGHNFTDDDLSITGRYLWCDRDQLIYNPPEWMRRGLQETASGYGKMLNSGYSIRFEGRVYRLYVTIFSNNGTVWFKHKGGKVIVHSN